MTMRVGGDIPANGLEINLDIFNTKSYPGSGTSIYNVARSQYTGVHTITGTGYVLEDGIPCIDCATDDADIIAADTNIRPAMNTEYNYYSFCKVKADPGTWRTLFRTIANSHPILIQTGGLLGMYNGGFKTSGYNMDSHDNTWISICVNAYSTVSDFYINGNYVGQANTNVVGTNLNHTIGNWIGGNQEWGWISQAMFYSRQLTVGEIKDIHNTFKSRYGI